MKKVIAVIACLIGFGLIICAAGTDDYYVMHLHQEHSLNWLQEVIGILMCIPLPVILNKEGEHGSGKTV